MKKDSYNKHMNMYSYVGEVNMEIEKCDVTVIHQDSIDKVKKDMLVQEDLIRMADLFKVFGDATRLRIINALMLSEMCVCDLSALLEVSQSAISHQLRILKQTRLVKYRREGKVVYYSLDDEHIENIFVTGYSHISER